MIARKARPIATYSMALVMNKPAEYFLHGFRNRAQFFKLTFP